MLDNVRQFLLSVARRRVKAVLASVSISRAARLRLMPLEVGPGCEATFSVMPREPFRPSAVVLGPGVGEAFRVLDFRVGHVSQVAGVAFDWPSFRDEVDREVGVPSSSGPDRWPGISFSLFERMCSVLGSGTADTRFDVCREGLRVELRVRNVSDRPVVFSGEVVGEYVDEPERLCK